MGTDLDHEFVPNLPTGDNFSDLGRKGARSSNASRWEPLREGLEAWTALQFDAKFALNIGSEKG